mgnify:CR=1 FL=1
MSERINNLVRLFNVREGISEAEDNLPERFKREPLKKGASKGQVVDATELQKMISNYYNLRGWDTYGRPKFQEIS